MGCTEGGCLRRGNQRREAPQHESQADEAGVADGVALDAVRILVIGEVEPRPADVEAGVDWLIVRI